MRQAGTLANQIDAQRFVAFLVTQGIAAHAEQDASGWVVWVRDEDHLVRAKDELQRFRGQSSDARYDGVEQTATAIRREEERVTAERRKNIVEVRNRWGGVRARNCPLTIVLIGLSIGVALLTGFGSDRDGTALRTLEFCDWTHGNASDWDWSRPANRLVDVRRGEVWRLVTPIFLHFGQVHLIFNMFWLFQLGGPIEEQRGTARFGLLVLLIAVLSVAVQSLAPLAGGGSPFGGGMSGVVYGLFGYVWMSMRFEPGSRLRVSNMDIVLMMGWLLLGIFGVLESTMGLRVANWAHLVGLVVGAAAGYLPQMFSGPRRR